MDTDKNVIINNICYTDLVYGRINKKLSLSLNKSEIEEFISGLLQETSEKYYSRVGKNYYVTNIERNIRVTINANTFRIITADRLP